MSDETQNGQNNNRYRETLVVTLVGSVIDLALGVAKIIIGLMAHSQALIADGIHSFSDLLTDFMVIYAAKHANREADEEHPYGHARIETLATVILGIALIAVAAGLAFDAVRRLFQPELLLHPGPMALVVAGLSIVSKEAIYHYTMTVARRHNSDLLKANAWHSRSDAISSIIVVVGVAGTMAGLTYLDAVAAVGVALMIAKIGWDMGWNSLRELIDTGLEAERVRQIEETILEVDGVKAMHLLRTRRMGGSALVDVHIQVAPRLSVSEGHQISEAVRGNLISKIDEISDVTVHIDPEDDEMGTPCRNLPGREEIEHRLTQHLGQHGLDLSIQDITIHYLAGRIELVLVLPLSRLGQTSEAQTIRKKLGEALADIECIRKIDVLYR